MRATKRQRQEAARNALREAMATVCAATDYAMRAAPTVHQQDAVDESARFARAAIKGMAHALSDDWPRKKEEG